MASQTLAVPNELAGDVRVFLNDGAGGYSSFVIFPLPGSSCPSTNEGSDFNSDGVTDIAVGSLGSNQVSLLMGDGIEGFLPEVNLTGGNSIRGLDILDADGDYDIAASSPFPNDVPLLL